jgi:hypothetical protein
MLQVLATSWLDQMRTPTTFFISMDKLMKHFYLQVIKYTHKHHENSTEGITIKNYFTNKPTLMDTKWITPTSTPVDSSLNGILNTCD